MKKIRFYLFILENKCTFLVMDYKSKYPNLCHIQPVLTSTFLFIKCIKITWDFYAYSTIFKINGNLLFSSTTARLWWLSRVWQRLHHHHLLLLCISPINDRTTHLSCVLDKAYRNFNPKPHARLSQWMLFSWWVGDRIWVHVRMDSK